MNTTTIKELLDLLRDKGTEVAAAGNDHYAEALIMQYASMVLRQYGDQEEPISEVRGILLLAECLKRAVSLSIEAVEYINPEKLIETIVGERSKPQPHTDAPVVRGFGTTGGAGAPHGGGGAGDSKTGGGTGRSY